MTFLCCTAHKDVTVSAPEPTPDSVTGSSDAGKELYGQVNFDKKSKTFRTYF